MRSDVSDNEGSIGVISDTHGLVRPEVMAIFRDVSIIVHAGDIGGMNVLKSLETIAPVTAVRGNVDSGQVAVFLNETETFEFGTFKFHVLHDLARLSLVPAACGIHMVISGHTHLPDVRTDNGVTYLNPGSAGPKRLDRSISLAKIIVQKGRLRVSQFNL